MSVKYARALEVFVTLALPLSCSGEKGDSLGDERFAPTAKVREALTTCTELGASADAFVSNPPIDQNFGSLPILRIGGKDESLVRFELGSIPASAVVESATLKLYVAEGSGGAPVNLHRATAAWNEPIATFASFSQQFDPILVGSIVTTTSNVQKAVDLTTVVKAWVTGAQPNHGILLETSSSKKTILVSREGGRAEQKPGLEVCYSLPTDHCSSNPCAHEGRCENGEASSTCHCAPGWTGATCESPIDDCADDPCLNGGTCNASLGGFTCACAFGYTGEICETLVDNCASQPCQNGGVCQNAVGSFECHCPPGFDGTRCETLLDNCSAGPCQNGGTCTNEVNTYSCACTAGFVGDNCEIDIDDCASAPCRNGGTCIDGINGFSCSCSPDRGGTLCEVNLNTCAQSPCLNGAACSNGHDTYTCSCVPGFTGTNCEIDVNDCAANPCLNGGICVDGVNGYACSCTQGFMGTNCETPTCAAGLANCDGNLANGCETNTTTSVTNCGACGHACTAPAGTTAACVAGACSVASCPTGFIDCDGSFSNGCEFKLSTAPTSCPRLGMVLSGAMTTSFVLAVANSPFYVAGDLTVGALNIQPGVEVRFAPTDALHSGADTSRVELIVTGALNIVGTTSQPVTLRGATATGGSWAGITVSPQATQAVLQHVHIRDAVDGFRTFRGGSITDAFFSNIQHNAITAEAQLLAERVWIQGPGAAGLQSNASSVLRAVTISGGFTTGVLFNTSVGRSLQLVNSRISGASYGVIAQGVDGGLTIESSTIHGSAYANVYVAAASSSLSPFIARIHNSIVTQGRYNVFAGFNDIIIDVDHSDVWGASQANFVPSTLVTGVGSVSVDPLYVLPGVDFRLQAGSPVIDIGDPNGAPNQDLAGASRPAGIGYDLGCYEYQP